MTPSASAFFFQKKQLPCPQGEQEFPENQPGNGLQVTSVHNHVLQAL